MKIVLYTHSEYSDLWEPFLLRLKKHLKFFKLITFCDKNKNNFWHNSIQYNDKLLYTDRLVQCFSFIKDEPVLFLHEDMVLFNDVDLSILQRFVCHINNRSADFIKLIKAGNFSTHLCNFDKNLVRAPFELSFSIQPTIGLSSSFLKLFHNSEPSSIWDFESNSSNICKKLGFNNCFMSHVEGEPIRGMHHYDSFIFPYIATAIVKGKWNASEYPKELDSVFKEYNINPSFRGIR